MKPLKRVMRITKRFLDRRFGTVVDEIFWSFRNKKWAEKSISEENLNHPHRSFLIEKVAEHLPFQSLLEVGCASGPNIYLLAKKYPQKDFYGVEINKKAVKTGNNFFLQRNVQNAKLFASKAEDLSRFSDKSIDIILTDASLVCIGPDKIEKVMKEMLRVARKVLVLNEWSSTNSSEKSVYNDHWLHDWKRLFAKFVPTENIMFTKIPGTLWEGEWKKHGYIIEIVLI